MESVVGIEPGEWWIHRETRAEYRIDFCRHGNVYLLNPAGSPSGRYCVEEFRDEFYNKEDPPKLYSFRYHPKLVQQNNH